MFVRGCVFSGSLKKVDMFEVLVFKKKASMAIDRFDYLPKV